MSILIPVGILVAGAIGTLLRAVVTDIDGDFDRQVIGTLAVNVVGSFLLGLLSGSGGDLAVIAAVGGLGSLTTFSTFISQVESMYRETTMEKAATYVLISVIAGVVAALIGIAVAP